MNLEFANGWLNRNKARAARVEHALRDIASLPVNLDINGIEVRQFNLEHWLILSKVRSPFLVPGRAPTSSDIGLFLWVVSPEHQIISGSSGSLLARLRSYLATRKRRAFLRRVVTQSKWDSFEPGIRRYLKRAFMDRPPVGGAGKQISAGLGASYVYRVAYVTGWSRKEIRQMPIAEVFQYLNWIAGPSDMPQFSPLQDAVNKRFMNLPCVNPPQSATANNLPVNGSELSMNGVEVHG